MSDPTATQVAVGFFDRNMEASVYPCTLMQEMSKIIFAFQMHISCSSMQNKIEIIIRRIAIHDDERIIVLGRCTGA